MTREEAIEEVKNYENYPNGLSKECRDYIIKALEHEPKILPIAEIKYDEDKLKELMNKAVFTAVTPQELPSVTPIRPKGHWVLTDVEGYRVWHCHCSECGKDPQDYIGGSENWWLIKSKLPKFCPTCGSNNGEVEECPSYLNTY